MNSALELFGQGLDTLAIAKRLGISEAKAYNQLHAERGGVLHVPVVNRPKPAPVAKVKEPKVHSDAPKLVSIPKTFDEPRTTRGAVLHLREARWTYSEIADLLDISERRVAQIVSEARR